MKTRWIGIALAIVWASAGAAQEHGKPPADAAVELIAAPAAFAQLGLERTLTSPTGLDAVAKRRAKTRRPSGAAFEIDEDEAVTGGWTTVSASGDPDWVDIDRDPNRAPFSRLTVLLSRSRPR